MKTTEVSDLFIEIDQINLLLTEIFSSPSTIIRGWPALYQLYVHLCRLEFRCVGAARSLSTESFDTTRPFNAAPVKYANEEFSGLARNLVQIVQSLCPLTSSGNLDIGDSRLSAVFKAHFHVKSDWFFSFPEVYCAGVISDDGCWLTRRVLTLNSQVANRIELDHRAVLAVQNFEIHAPAFQEKLESRCCESGLIAANARQTIKNLFLTRCTVSDLLDPLSR